MEFAPDARVSCAPVDGAANASLIRLLAHALGVPRTAVTLLRGKKVAPRTAHGRRPPPRCSRTWRPRNSGIFRAVRAAPDPCLTRASAVTKHALSDDTAPRIEACESTAAASGLRACTPAMARGSRPSNAQTLKKKAFPHQQRRKKGLRKRAHVLFFAPILLRAALLRSLSLHSRSSAKWRKKVAHRPSRRS
ncbi:MAG: DUF167 domain-containing protein [Steroidobacteraceae bacterium]